MMDSYMYVKEVDKLLARLRMRCLGYNTSLYAFLPKGAENWSAEERAAYITSLLVFALADADPMMTETESLQKLSDWLYTLLLFLGRHCSREDYTIASIKKILDMEEGARASMFMGLDEFSQLTRPPHWLLVSSYFDVAMQNLLDANGLAQERWKYLHKPGLQS